LSKAVFWVGFAAAAAWFAWACIDPVGMGWTLGASAVPFIGFASIVPVGSMAVYWARAGGTTRVDDEGDRQRDPRVGYPVVTLLAAFAVLFSAWGDNHGVRTFDAATRATATSAADTSPAPATPASAAEAWLRREAGAAGAPTDLVVVAAAGGGIRAAYWTATVLGALQDCAPALRRKLFAVSGVSGGSLGAVTFATLLSQNAERAAAPCPTDGKADFAAGPYEAAAQRVLSHDFLAPTVASLLFPDLMQRLLPWNLLPDRAAGLEKGWERAWGDAGLDADTWSGHAFDDLWRDARGPVPALLLNGTSVESGRRIVTSNLKIDPAVFRDSVDFFDAFGGRAIRASTAAHNSARFTYVSPAGRVNDATRIVDGGYFENFGAKTASEVLGAALAQSQRIGVAVRPIVIVISNGPQMRPAELPPDSVGSQCPACGPDPKPGLTFASEALSPLLALLHTRDAHGTRAAHDLHDAAVAAGGRFYHFRLCPDPQAPEPALGWVLSKASERSMQRQLRAPNACGNREQFDDLVRLLGR
jgi:predicted acylesterase/phospholipase RssA